MTSLAEKYGWPRWSIRRYPALFLDRHWVVFDRYGDRVAARFDTGAEAIAAFAAGGVQ